MNYLSHYNCLIERAKNRANFGTYEKHHIFPKCLGGSDEIENIVKLTPREHFVAHQLLVKIYPNNDKLIYALALMPGEGTDNYKRNNRLHGWLRKKLSSNKSEEHKKKISISMSGKKKTEEHKKKISESLIGCKKGPMTAEQKYKISQSLIGRVTGPCSEEKRIKIGQANKGKNTIRYICTNCGKSGNGSVMFRYHFDRCKQ